MASATKTGRTRIKALLTSSTNLEVRTDTTDLLYFAVKLYQCFLRLSIVLMKKIMYNVLNNYWRIKWTSLICVFPACSGWRVW